MFEAAGLATLVITTIRSTAERMRPPRALYAEFPLGLPLGKPGDAEFQHQVLDAAFSLLRQPKGPVLADFPQALRTSDSPPLACPLPRRRDADLHPAVDEAQALRPAYDRALAKKDRTSVGMCIGAAEVPAEIAKFVKIAAGEPWDRVGMKSLPGLVAHDIRAYYEELALELAEGPFAAKATERWFYEKTETGQLLLAVRRAMRKAEAPRQTWFLISPASYQ